MSSGKKILLDPGQNIIDIALQEYGDYTAIIDMATLNNVSITDDIAPATELLIGGEVKQKRVSNYFNINSKPATGASDKVYSLPEGISVWAIGIDFEVQ